MLEGIAATLSQALAQNQFLSGGFLLMASGFVMAWARKLPQLVLHWIYRKLTTSIEITGRDPVFHWVQKWLAAQPRTRRYPFLSASAAPAQVCPNSKADTRPAILLTPAPGRFWLRYEGCWMRISRERKEHTGKDGFVDYSEMLTLWILSRDRGLGRRFLDLVRDFAQPPESRILSIFTPSWDSWCLRSQAALRGPETVILEEGVMEGLLADAGQFLASEQWYRDRGLAHRRGYLLYGPPGNGKSSAIMAVAAHLRFDVYCLSLGIPEMNDSRLRNLFSNLPARSILVIEDIDRDMAVASDGAVKTTNERVPLSSLLNMLDGIGAAEGRILFMTTNHRDRLDPALIRPGRADRQIEFKDASVRQAERLFLRFFPGEESLARFFAYEAGDRGLSMATLQGHLLQHRDDPDAAMMMATQLVAAADEVDVSQTVS